MQGKSQVSLPPEQSEGCGFQVEISPADWLHVFFYFTASICKLENGRNIVLFCNLN